jgi:hypothetical protein
MDIDGVNFLTDPFFGAIEGTEYDSTPVWEQVDLKQVVAECSQNRTASGPLAPRLGSNHILSLR